MTLIESLVQVPYLMRPNLAKVDERFIKLHPEGAAKHVRESCHSRLTHEEHVDLWVMLLNHLDQAGRVKLTSHTTFNPELLTSLELLHSHYREDLVVMNALGELDLLFVSNPSGWAPEERLGASFAEIHQRVPDSDHIKRAGPTLVKLVMDAEQAYKRHVWTLAPTSARNRHPKVQAQQPTWDTTDQAYLRWETQTFLPFYPGEKVCFMIHVETLPLLKACQKYDDAVRVMASLETMTEAVMRYKGLDHPRVNELVRGVMDQTWRAS